MKKILLITTGGTIASLPTASGVAPQLDGEALRDIVMKRGGVSDIQLSVADLFALDSCNITPKHWLMIARRIADERRNYDGFIVAHGTDTMAYTAAALYYMLENIEVPVVLTGSQLTLVEENSDAADNLRLAMLAAGSGRGGVYLAFGSRLIAGNAAKKLYTAELDAFRSINRSDVAGYDGNELRFEEVFMPPSAKFRLHEYIGRRVAVLQLVPNMPAKILTQLVDAGNETVIIVAFGMGGVAGAEAGDEYNLLPAIGDAVSRGVRIIITTQCLYDGADISHYEVGRRAVELGATHGGKLTVEALYAKAMLGLA